MRIDERVDYWQGRRAGTSARAYLMARGLRFPGDDRGEWTRQDRLDVQAAMRERRKGKASPD